MRAFQLLRHPLIIAVPAALISCLASAASSIPNGDFESGRTSWVETSSNGFAAIVATSITPHGGNWLAWFGGADNETTTISQSVVVPASDAYLYYWHQTQSDDVPGFDIGYVRVNGTQVDTYDLASNTAGWVRRMVDLNAYAGQTVTLKFEALTDFVSISNWYVDDVGWQTTPALFRNGFENPVP